MSTTRQHAPSQCSRAARNAMQRDVALTEVHVAPAWATTWLRSLVPDDLDTWTTSIGKQVVANATKTAHAATGDNDALKMDSDRLHSTGAGIQRQPVFKSHCSRP